MDGLGFRRRSWRLSVDLRLTRETWTPFSMRCQEEVVGRRLTHAVCDY